MAGEFDSAVSRLAQYRPFAHEGRDVQAAVRDLVLGAAAEAGGGFASLGGCRGAIKTLFGLDIEFDELREVVDQLSEEGAVVKSGGGFELSTEQHQQLEAQSSESAKTEERAFADWETTVRAIDPELTEQDFAALREDLDAWLQKVISRHGVEAALILYPENPRAHELYRSLEGLGLSFLRRDRSAAVGRIRERAIQLFVQQPTPEQRTYLSNLLNVSYFLTVLSLDPSASRLVQDRVQGHRIYLDTNVLYRALGLSKVREVLSARRLLELSKQLGFELAITPWTLTEMKESLRRAEQSVKNRALPPRELAHLMAEATSQEGFVTAYWRQYKDKGITPNDFFAFYSALETLLEQDGIALINEGVIAVDFNESAINEELPVLESVLLGERAEPVLRHDVKHRLLIERLRGDGNLTFANARYWFLTQDSALPRYAELRNDDDEVGVPFCASTSSWTQTMRSLVPRTDDLDQALVDLLASPYMRYRGGVSPQLVQEVVARIDQFEGVSANLASEVLLNGALIREVARTDNAQERAAKIDNALIKSAEHLHEKLETISRSETEAREARRAAEAERLSSESEVERAYARIHELERALEERQATEAGLTARLSETESRHQSAAHEAAERQKVADRERQELAGRVAETERQLKAQEAADAARATRGTTIRWVVAGTLWAVAVIGVAVLVALGVVVDVWPIVGLVLAGLLLVCLGILIVFDWKAAWRTFVVIGAVIGLIAGLQQVVEAATEDPATTPASESN